MRTWEKIFLVSSVIFAYLAGSFILNWIPSFSLGSVVSLLWRGLVSATCLILACICLHIWQLQPADSHTLKSVLIQYIFLRLLPLTLGWYGSRKIASQVKTVRETQEKFLLDILSRASNTTYGKLMNFSSIKSVAEFRKKQILTSYEHFRHYIEAIVAGEQNVLFSDKPFLFGTTSGTTGRDKVMPVVRRGMHAGMPAFMSTMRSNFTHQPRLGRVVRLNIRARPRATGCGVPIGPLSGIGPLSLGYDVTPPVYGGIHYEPTVLYIHALFSLAEEDLTFLEGGFSPLTYAYFRIIEEKWQTLCDDIESGTIDESIDLQDDVRTKINNHLKTNPVRAAQLRQEFNKGFQGIAKRIWPNLSFAMLLTTGSFANYTRIVFSSYMAGVHYWSQAYGSTEGIMAIGLAEKSKIGQYQMMLTSVFMEFIPEQDTDAEQPETLLMHELTRGCSYEVVMTTNSGLYRYRLGDVIKVVDFTEQCPIIEYQYRLGAMLNLAQEFTTETHLYTAIQKAEEQWDDVTLIDYTASDSLALQTLGLRQNKEDRHHYVVFIEVSRRGQDYNLSEKNKMAIEEHLRSGHEGYDKFRVGKLGAMEVIQMTSGTFARLKAALTARSPNPSFKMPRVLKKEEGLQLLLDSVHNS